jgi:hypothetical protein
VAIVVVEVELPARARVRAFEESARDAANDSIGPPTSRPPAVARLNEPCAANVQPSSGREVADAVHKGNVA